MTPMTPLGVKPQLWLIVWLGPPKTPNGPPRGALCCTHRTQGNIHFFLLQWNIGGPEWPPNDPHDPPNKFAMFLGSNCAPQWGNKKFHDLVTVILSGNYLYAMLSKFIFWKPPTSIDDVFYERPPKRNTKLLLKASLWFGDCRSDRVRVDDQWP